MESGDTDEMTQARALAEAFGDLRWPGLSLSARVDACDAARDGAVVRVLRGVELVLRDARSGHTVMRTVATTDLASASADAILRDMIADLRVRAARTRAHVRSERQS